MHAFFMTLTEFAKYPGIVSSRNARFVLKMELFSFLMSFFMEFIQHAAFLRLGDVKIWKNKCKNVANVVTKKIEFLHFSSKSSGPLFQCSLLTVFSTGCYTRGLDHRKGLIRAVFRYNYCYLSTCISNLKFVT